MEKIEMGSGFYDLLQTAVNRVLLFFSFNLA